MLQKALDDSALEVVVEAAEGLESLGALSAAPVLAGLLHHHSEAVRRRPPRHWSAWPTRAVLNDLLTALDDASPTVRFSLVGALAHAGREGGGLSEEQRKRLLARLETVLQHDADPGVRSRAATALGDCGAAAKLAALWRCVAAARTAACRRRRGRRSWRSRRVGSLPLLQEWDRTLASAKQGPRRLQLLAEVAARWQKRPETKTAAAPAQEMLVQDKYQK